jgi:hypothetical protein
MVRWKLVRYVLQSVLLFLVFWLSNKW